MIKTINCPECLRTSEIKSEHIEDDMYIEPRFCPFCGYEDIDELSIDELFDSDEEY
tara:strand:- start:236 stop:403 length:168 start_codon:yes stop_codon:yes gene_type:complete